jgi:hypothetical protein
MVLGVHGRGRRPSQDLRRGKAHARLADAGLGAAALIGGGEPLICGAVGAGSCVSSGMAPAESHRAVPQRLKLNVAGSSPLMHF